MEFEPNAGEVLNALLPRYIQARVFNAMLQSAASEHAASLAQIDQIFAGNVKTLASSGYEIEKEVMAC
jgi:F0F1-type ATP synthase gamma subunit